MTINKFTNAYELFYYVSWLEERKRPLLFINVLLMPLKVMFIVLMQQVLTTYCCQNSLRVLPGWAGLGWSTLTTALQQPAAGPLEKDFVRFACSGRVEKIASRRSLPLSAPFHAAPRRATPQGRITLFRASHLRNRFAGFVRRVSGRSSRAVPRRATPRAGPGPLALASSDSPRLHLDSTSIHRYKFMAV